MVFFLYVVALFGVLLVFIRYSLWREKYTQQLPGIKPGFFNILGDLVTLFKVLVSNDGFPKLHHLMLFIKERSERFHHQKLFYVWYFYNPHVCLIKAEAVKQLLSKGTRANEKSWNYEYLKLMMGTGLVLSSIEKWKPRRKMLTPCFHADILRGFLTVFNEHSQKLVEHLRQETNKEFTYVLTPVTLTVLHIIFETILGTTIDALHVNSSKYITAMDSVSEVYMKRNFKIWEWSDFIFNLTSGREARHHQKLLNEITNTAIEKKKEEYFRGKKDDGKGKRMAFMDLLLKLHFETKELSEKDIHDEVNTFFAAGHETVSLTITWTLYLIGLYPDIQTKLHEEIERIFGKDTDREVTESDLNDLKYLDCVLKESHRLYSIIPIIGRRLLDDTNICGHTIPKDSTCFILIDVIHKDRDVFPDPEKFDPDRFLPENSVKIPEYGYIPFSAGSRNCIGKQFAIMEIKTIMSYILRNYTVESLDSRDKVLPIIRIVLQPSIPIRIRFRPK